MIHPALLERLLTRFLPGVCATERWAGSLEVSYSGLSSLPGDGWMLLTLPDLQLCHTFQMRSYFHVLSWRLAGPSSPKIRIFISGNVLVVTTALHPLFIP